MVKILEFLRGKKTYIVALIAGVFNFGVSVGWWLPDNTTWMSVNALLGAIGLGTLRAAVEDSK